MVLLGTGTGIAFFMLMAHLSRDVAFIARTAGVVVLADFIFTLTAVILQPITGYLLTLELGIPLTEVLDLGRARTLCGRRLLLAAGRLDAGPHARSRPRRRSGQAHCPSSIIACFASGSCSASRASEPSPPSWPADDRQAGAVAMTEPNITIGILGASGLIGHALTIALQRRYQVIPLARRFTPAQRAAHRLPGRELALADLSDTELADAHAGLRNHRQQPRRPRDAPGTSTEDVHVRFVTHLLGAIPEQQPADPRLGTRRRGARRHPFSAQRARHRSPRSARGVHGPP